MATTSPKTYARRRFLWLGARLSVLGSAALGSGAWSLAALPPTPAAAAGGPVVTLLGDSITAGYGLPAAAALPAQLSKALAARGVVAHVRGAGVSGDTTADGLARAGFSVQADTALCVVALGGNDLLQGLDPARTRANLERLVRQLKSRKIAVLLVGLTAPKAIGSGYAHEFNAVFPAVARSQKVPLYPDLLAGVSGRAALVQPDGVHPNAQGAAKIAGRLAPAVIQALKVRSGS